MSASSKKDNYNSKGSDGPPDFFAFAKTHIKLFYKRGRLSITSSIININCHFFHYQISESKEEVFILIVGRSDFKFEKKLNRADHSDFIDLLKEAFGEFEEKYFEEKVDKFKIHLSK